MTDAPIKKDDLTADVVVVGAGAAGLMAALSATEAGADVVLLEKASRVGGKSGIAIGSITASETDMQRAAGIGDSHADHLADMAALADRAGIALDLDKARLRIAEDARTLQRLIDMGVTFSGPHPEGPHKVPRMHNTVPGPRAMVDTLEAACRDAGVRILTAQPAAELIHGPEGRLEGVVAQSGGATVRIRTPSVVLSAGDHIANRDLLRRHAPEARLAEPILPTHTGDAYRMATEAGARSVHMHRVSTPQTRTTVWPHVEPSPGLYELGAALVDRQGTPRPEHSDEAVAAEDDLFMIIDSTVAESLAKPGDDSGPGRDGWQRTGRPFIGTAPDVAYAYLEDCFDRSWYRRATTVGEIAAIIGCAEDTLEKSMKPDAAPPFHLIGPMRRYLIGVGGALDTDTTMAVVDGGGAPIPGLFAAGDTASWMEYAGGHGYGISWAATSGRLAGAAAAAFAALKTKNG